MKHYSFLRMLLILPLFVVGCAPETRRAEVSRIDSSNTREAESQMPAGSEITVTGRLINTLCFGADDPADYDTSLECAKNNTSLGLPVAVHESDKAVDQAWILVTPPQIFTDYMHQTVRVRGEVRSEGVLVPVRVELETETGWMFIM